MSNISNIKEIAERLRNKQDYQGTAEVNKDIDMIIECCDIEENKPKIDYSGVAKYRVLEIIDSCFHMYASSYRTEAKNKAIEMMTKKQGLKYEQ